MTEEKIKKPWYQKWWGILLVVFGVMLTILITYSAGVNKGHNNLNLVYNEGYDAGYKTGYAEAKNKYSTKAKQVETTGTKETASNPASSAPAPKQWVEVKSFSGSGNKTTEDFNINSNKWRITASGSSSNPEMASISVYVYQSGKNPDTDSSDAQLRIEGNGPETTYPKLGSGTYFLEVGSANTNWTVKIEEEK
jgi:hypothetical protein